MSLVSGCCPVTIPVARPPRPTLSDVCRIVIVQHGEKVSAPGDPGLTAFGVDQARRTAQALQRVGPHSALLSSPLRRARETAEPVARVLGLQVEVDDRLTERMNWDGESDFDDFISEWQQATADRDYVPTAGDSSRAAGARFMEALDQRCQEGAASLIAVAHGGVTVDLLRTILGDAIVEENWPALLHDGVPPCALTRLIHRDGSFVVESVAEVGQL